MGSLYVCEKGNTFTWSIQLWIFNTIMCIYIYCKLHLTGVVDSNVMIMTDIMFKIIIHSL